MPSPPSFGHLAESLHNLIDAEAVRLHQVIDELLARTHRTHVSTRQARICVDPGHGGDDPGAVVGQVREADVVLEYGMELERVLRARGHLTRQTRTDDLYVPLSARAEISNTFSAEVFVSLHANFASNQAAEGAWIIHASRSRLGKALAEAVFRKLADIPGIGDADLDEEVFPDASGWVGGRRLAVLRQTLAPAILIELGFLSNPDDQVQLLAVDTRRSVAMAIADGIEGWLETRT